MIAFFAALAMGGNPLLTPLPEDRIAVMRAREADWRIGPVVYQVFVDRFAPSASLEKKLDLYKAPRRLMKWTDLPVGGTSRPEVGVWSHELDFWGGDLPSLRSKLDHVADLADVLYLNPIHEALTNHKYDATDWNKVAPEFGTESDFEGLVSDVHGRKMRFVLDGVFNHCGKSNPLFQQANSDPKSKYRDWFTFDRSYPNGYRAWAGVPNLPEVHLENESARKYLWLDSDSVVANWLKRGADGWRLDVAHELGLDSLSEITKSAHKFKTGSLVIGEVWNYPARWTNSMDGLQNMFLGRLIVDFANGEYSSRQVAESLTDLIADCGIEPLLRSWIIFSNHDTDRLASEVSDPQRRHLVQAIQFAMPGAPLIYYGDEVGMTGVGDPAQRAPMQWDMVNEKNPDWAWTKKLVKARKELRALRIGDCRPLRCEKVFGLIRTTEKPLEAVIVLANPSNEAVTESWVIPDPTLMGYTLMRDKLSGETVRIHQGTLRMSVPPKSVRYLAIDDEAIDRGQYKRMKDGE